jgi:hypothetical protein
MAGGVFGKMYSDGESDQAECHYSGRGFLKLQASGTMNPDRHYSHGEEESSPLPPTKPADTFNSAMEDLEKQRASAISQNGDLTDAACPQSTLSLI